MATIRLPSTKQKLTIGHLIGGPDDLWRDLRAKIADEYGIDLISHAERCRSSRAIDIPKSARVVVILNDFTSKMVQKAAIKESTWPVVLIGRKRVTWPKGFRAAGFEPRPKETPEQWLEVVKVSESKPPVDEYIVIEPEAEPEPSEVSEPPAIVEDMPKLLSVPVQPVLPLAPVVPLPSAAQAPRGSTGDGVTEEEEAKLVELLRLHPTAKAFFAALVNESRYRTPGAMGLAMTYNPRIRSAAAPDFRPALAGLQREMDAKRDRLKEREKEARKLWEEGDRTKLPDWFGKSLAVELVGFESRLNKLRAQDVRFDPDLGLKLYRREGVLKLREEYVALIGSEDVKVKTSAKASDEEIADALMLALAEGPQRMETLRRRSKTNKKHRMEAQLKKILDAGLAIQEKTYGGVVYTFLPEHRDRLNAIVEAKKDREHEWRSTPPAPASSDPVADLQQRLAEDIMQQVKEGKMSYTQAADLVARMRGTRLT